MSKSARKYIIIPEYRPLFAMSECYGPKHGPLKEPCPTPINVIGKLLLQKGNDALTIMEVLKNPDGTTTEPVRLTLGNYTLPYEQILNGEKVNTSAALTSPDTSNDTEVSPVYIDDITVDTSNAEGADNIEPSVYVQTEDKADQIAKSSDEETSSETITESTPDPYAGMTKSERKAAKRAAREAELAASLNQTNNN